MTWTTYFGIITGIAAVVATLMNVLYANAATIQPYLESKELPKNVMRFTPDNKLSPTALGPGAEYLDLVLLNEGPGVAKVISWMALKVEAGKNSAKVLSERNTLPYIGKGSKVNVLGYIEKANTVERAKEITYEVKVHFKPILGIRGHELSATFDGSGTMKEYQLDGEVIPNHYPDPHDEGKKKIPK